MIADARARGYAGGIDRLARHGALIAGSIFAHGVHLTRAEVTACADAGVEMVDGQKSVIQPLGGYFGSAHEAPWILLDKDDRTGAASDGENLYVYRPEMIRRMVVFALIYEGAADFQSVGGYLSIRDGDGSETLVELNNPDANRTFCAIAMVTNTGGGIEIRKEERYFTRHRECDAFFQFGFDWTPGQK